MKNHFDYSKAMRKASREAQVLLPIVNRKKEANKKACRKKFTI